MKTKLSIATAALTLGLIGSAQALPNEATFTAAGLGPSAGWTLIGTPETFGTGGGGNGFLSTGGTAEFELRLADYGHRFGTSNTGHGGLNVIFDTASDAVGAVDSWAPAVNPFLFYFQTKDGVGGEGLDDGYIFSDGFRIDDPTGQLDMAIYQNNSDPTRFALFFDDGGPSDSLYADDNDYNDMVVTVQGRGVSEPGALAIFGLGLAALGYLGRRRKAA